MAAVIVALVLFVELFALPAHAFDNGQYANSSPERRAWFKGLIVPNSHQRSFCNASDCHETDFEYKDNHYRAMVGYPNSSGEWMLRTWVDVPDEAVIKDREVIKTNPTGRAVICQSIATYHVFCFVPGAGL